MPQIFNNLLHTSAQASSARHAEETQNIGEHPLPALEARLKDTLEGDVTNTFNQGGPVASIGLNNMVMLSALQAVNGVLSKSGIYLPEYGQLPGGILRECRIELASKIFTTYHLPLTTLFASYR